MDRTDDQLIEAYRDGEEKALAVLVERYLKPIYNFAYRLGGDTDLAADITQDTFVKAWRQLKTYELGSSFRAWLFTIARRTTIDALRKNKTFSFSDFTNDDGGNVVADNLVSNEPWPDEVFAQAELGTKLEAALKNLSIVEREIILLHASDDLTFEQIAAIIGQPMNTVKSRYRRARLKLQAYLIAPKFRGDAYKEYGQ